MQHLQVRLIVSATMCAMVLAAALPARAHHSFAGYESVKTVTLEGTVKSFQWSNPHVVFGLWVKDETHRQPQEWNIITSGPTVLTRFGWDRNSIKPGDRVSIVCNPLSDGSRGGRLHTVVKLDTGETLRTKLSAATETQVADP